MNKKIQKYMFVGALFICALGIGFFGVRLVFSTDTQKMQASTEQSVVEDNCEDVCIDIEADGFSKPELGIPVGTVVQFNTKDGEIHNLALGSGTENHVNTHTDLPGEQEEDSHGHEHLEGTESGEFGAGEAWRVEFKETGTYFIHDHYFPNNTLLVVVYDEESKI